MRVFNVHTTTSRQQMNTFARVIVDSSNSEEAEEAVINASLLSLLLNKLAEGSNSKLLLLKLSLKVKYIVVI